MQAWDPAFQSFWEFATLLLVLCTWGDRFCNTRIAIHGDNTAALNNALSYRGRGPMEAVARELSWRQARRGWLFGVSHLPAEFNVVADALSRVADPNGVPWPDEALSAAAAVSPPHLSDLWTAAPRG